MAKLKSKPGYYNEKPMLKTTSQIRDVLGLQDSCIQTNQIGVMLLEEQAKLSGDLDAFIKIHCKKYGVSLGTSDYEYFKSIQYKTYILQTYNLVEPFIKKLNKEYQLYHNFSGIWETQNSKKERYDPLTQFFVNQPGAIQRRLSAYPEYHLLHYYRLIRVSVSHLQIDPKANTKTTDYYEKNLKPIKLFFADNYEMDAPNMPENISFDDFKLYSRAIKYFSNILNDICFSNVEMLAEIARKDEVLEKKITPFREAKFYKRNLLRAIKLLISYFENRFSTSDRSYVRAFWRLYLDKENVDYSEYGHL